MNNFKDNGNRGGNRFGGKPSFGAGSRGGFKGGDKKFGDKPTQLFSATCSDCRKGCEVPFKPSGDKPVYCSDCFSNKKPDQNSGGRGDGYSSSNRSDSRFSPRQDSRPSRNSHAPRQDFTKPRNSDNDLRLQLVSIESKLNKILDLINPPLPAKSKLQKGSEGEVVTSEDKDAKKTIEKKVVNKASLKKVVENIVEKAPVKKAVVKKVVAKKAPVKKVVAKKAPVKKIVAKKVVKKTTKKTVVKK